MVKLVINKAFFGKNNCLKATLNDSGDFYFHFGILSGEKWAWKKVKMNDDELGSIILVLEGKKDSVSFIHDFKGEKTQLWVNRKEPYMFLKVKEVSKSLGEGEQSVLKELLRYSVLRMNMNL